MKLVKNFVLALLLISTLAVKTSAGEMPTPPSPDPRLTATSDEEGTSPVIGNPYAEQSGGTITETPDYLFFEALAALLSVY